MPLTREQRAEIARRNGAKSKGPKTEAGKAISRANGLKHGRRAKLLMEELASRSIADVEKLPAFQRLLKETVRLWAPANYAELSLVANIAADDWRIQRWNRVESTMLETEYRNVEREAAASGESLDRDEIMARAAAALAVNANVSQFLDAERRRLIRSRGQSIRLLRQMQNGNKVRARHLPVPAGDPLLLSYLKRRES
jgi:hypothetical protein